MVHERTPLRPAPAVTVNAQSPLAPYQLALLATIATNPHAAKAAETTPQRTMNTTRTPHVGFTPGTVRAAAHAATPSQAARVASASKPMAAPHAQACHEATPPRPPARSRVVDDLKGATKEELLQLLVDLSSLSAEAASFIDCKAQTLQLRHASSQAANPFGAVATTLDMAAEATPLKQTMTRADAAQHTEQHTGGRALPPATGASPYDRMEAEQNEAPERRTFCDELHPCLLQFGVCRNPQSCFFIEAPCNLCTAFVRGDCPNGSRCNYVHRLPEDCSPALHHLYQVKLARAGRAVFGTAAGSTPSRQRK